MSRSGDISFVWGDGEYAFRLALGELRRLQERTNAGPLELQRRLLQGTWRVDDIRETIRLGLEGGGMKAESVTQRINDYVDGRPLLDNVLVAARILNAALSGPEDELLGKQEAAEGESTSFQTDSSPSPQFTGGDPSLDIRPAT